MELLDVSSDIVADNTLPMTTIPMGSPRGEPVWGINKMLLEVEKSLLLGIDATKLQKSGAEEEEEVRKKEKGKEKEWNGSEGSLHSEMRLIEFIKTIIVIGELFIGEWWWGGSSANH